ncbi:MAG TPA: CopD family protein [Stellaceae bacterium]|nr:CopD family protein [Stellaceae bacterium]
MAALLDIFGFLSVILRGLILTAQSFVVGGVIFQLLLLRPLAGDMGAALEPIWRRCRILLFWSALVFALFELIGVTLQCAVLIGTVDITPFEAVTANFALAGLALGAVAIAIAGLSRGSRGVFAIAAMTVLAVLALVLQSATSHAMARLDDRAPLAVAEILHMAGAAVWIGGIPYFLIALNGVEGGAAWRRVGKRFSVMAMASVAMLLTAGIFMSVFYLGDFDALYGTAYGVMVVGKAGLLAGLLFLGGMNFLLVERLRRDPTTPVLRLKRFAEAELGIGLTVLFAAASLTSQPPAVDLTIDRASWAEVVERLTPEWPRLTSPDRSQLIAYRIELAREEAAKTHRQLPIAYVLGSGVLPPRDANDIAWSEYNHHWAGIAVLVIGLLALGERSRLVPSGKHWPLMFVVLAVFLFFRSDPEVWPLGEIGFFDSLRDPEVAQHRAFVLLIAAFGIFEWCVRTGRFQSSKPALAFPLLCATGSALLLTHQHNLVNVKEQLLIEITHLPIALLGVAAGWSRWLELRLAPPGNRIAGWVWPIAFALVGALLLMYRET